MKALRFTLDMLLMLLALVSLPFTLPALMLWLAWQRRKPVPKPFTTDFSEDSSGPRNDRDQPPAENHQA